MRRTITLACLALAALALVGVGSAGAQHNQTGQGHLLIEDLLTQPAGLDPDGEGDWGKIELLGKLVVPDIEPELIADLAVDPRGDFAYLAR